MMKNILTIIFILGLVSLNAAEQTSVEKAKSKTGIELFFENYDWDNMWAELTATIQITTCTPKDSKKGFISPYIATMAEPLYIADVTIRPGEIKSIGTNIGNNQENATGTNDESGGTYVNIIKFPIMDMLLQNTSRGALVFEKGPIKPLYIGMLDPKKWDNIMAADLSPEKQQFASVRAQLASVVSCVGYSGVDLFSPSLKRTSEAAERLYDSIDVFYYSLGCLGPLPPGTSTTHSDAISNGILAISSVFFDMYSKRGLVSDLDIKHTTQNILNGYSKKILCEAQRNPIFPQSAYSIQLLYPTISKTHELGIDPTSYNFHGAGESEVTVVFVINQRRDYAAFAYQD